MKKSLKLSDYVLQSIERIGVGHIFVLSGGGNIHLVDSLANLKKMRFICNHHEQACATAAEGYARISGNVGACLVTTGPGGTNAITGVMGAWLDSIPMIVISGQVRTELLARGTGLRQLGLQEIDIVAMVKGITKYAVMVIKPEEIRYHLEKALYLAKSGRPGPVWLDIPLDIQGAVIEPHKLKSFNPKEVAYENETDKANLRRLVSKTIERIRKSKRPVFYAGNGIRLAGAADDFLKLIDILKIPVLTGYVGYDLIPSAHPYFFGRSNALGQRAANFIVQNSDLLLSVGARMDILTTGYTYQAYARAAYKIMVNTDRAELKKISFKPDLPINYDAGEFIREMIRQVKKKPLKLNIQDWLGYGQRLNKKYPPVSAEFWQEKNYVNPYCFIETIGKLLKPGDIMVESDGVGPLNCMYQAFQVKSRQRIVLNLGCAQMGYGLPAAIGAAFAAGGKKDIICFEGDGSLQLNIQELQTVRHHNLPIKLFVYANDGYLSIRNTQKALFQSRFVAVGRESGLSCPDYVKVAKAYGLPAIRINNHHDMETKIKKVLAHDGPIVCEINSVRELTLTPRLMTKRGADGKFISPTLESMWPFLSEEEFKENMLIPLWQG